MAAVNPNKAADMGEDKTGPEGSSGAANDPSGSLADAQNQKADDTSQKDTESEKSGAERQEIVSTTEVGDNGGLKTMEVRLLAAISDLAEKINSKTDEVKNRTES